MNKRETTMLTFAIVSTLALLLSVTLHSGTKNELEATSSKLSTTESVLEGERNHCNDTIAEIRKTQLTQVLNIQEACTENISGLVNFMNK